MNVKRARVFRAGIFVCNKTAGGMFRDLDELCSRVEALERKVAEMDRERKAAEMDRERKAAEMDREREREAAETAADSGLAPQLAKIQQSLDGLHERLCAQQRAREDSDGSSSSDFASEINNDLAHPPVAPHAPPHANGATRNVNLLPRYRVL